MHQKIHTAIQAARGEIQNIMTGDMGNAMYGVTLVLAVLTTLVAGCAPVGPDYQSPGQPINNAYKIQHSTEGDDRSTRSKSDEVIPRQVFERTDQVRSDWYTLFGSKRLDTLIRQAVQNSPTLASGRARIQAARELVKQNKGALYPQVGVNDGISRNRVTGVESGTADSAQSKVFNLYQIRATASYNLDLFGKTHRRIERSNALLNEQQYDVLNTYVTLINNIVATAITEAGLNAAIKTTHQIADNQAHGLEILRKQIQYGVATRADATQIQTQLARTKASLEPLRKQKALAVNRLAVLVGKAPGLFSDPDFTLEQLQLPQELPVSVPSRLVKQRPDILAAAAAVHAASAQIGVASANMLPDVQISSDYGRAGLSLSDLGNPAYALYSLGASLSAPLFEGGRLRAAKRQARDLYRAARSDYRAIMLTAFGEVGNSLRSLEADARTLQARRKALDAARTNLNSVRTRLRSGATDYLDLYTAQSQFQEAELDFIKARVIRYGDTADLFRALGGGWANSSKVTSATSRADRPLAPT